MTEPQKTDNPIPTQEKLQVFLIPMQDPNSDLMRMSQVLSGCGMTPLDQHPSGDPDNPMWTFRTLDGASISTLQMYPDLGAFRLTLAGPEGLRLAEQLPQMIPMISQDIIAQQIVNPKATDIERQTFAALLVLSAPDCSIVLDQFSLIFEQKEQSLGDGVIDGLVFLATPKSGAVLRKLAERYEGQTLGNAAQAGYDKLVAKGIVVPLLIPEEALASAQTLINENPEEALALLNTLADEDSERTFAAEISLLQSQAFRALSQIEEALATLTDALADPTLKPQALVERAKCLERQGEPTGALEAIFAALHLSPELEEALTLKDRLQLGAQSSTGTPEEQLERLSQALEENPEEGDLLLQRANTLIALKRPEDALEDLKVANRVQPNDPRVAILRAEAHLQRGAFLSAFKALPKDLNNLPIALQKQAALLPGLIYLALDAPTHAARRFAETSRHHPEILAATLGRGIALERAGKNEEARSHYQQCIEDGDAADLLEELSPVCFQPCLLWEDMSGAPVTLHPTPPQRTGSDKLDDYFKYCLDCSTAAMMRRTSCKECSGKDFISK